MNTTDDYMRVTADYLTRQSHRRMAIVAADNPYQEELLSSLEKQTSPGAIVSVERCVPSDMDFRAIISRLKSKQLDAVGVFLLSGQISTFYRQSRELGWSIPTFGTNFFESAREVDQSYRAMDGAIFANNKVTEEFVRRYSARFGNESQLTFGALSYEFVRLLSRVYPKGSSIARETVLVELLNAQSTDDAVTGAYTFEWSQEAGRYFKFPLVIKRIANGRIIH